MISFPRRLGCAGGAPRCRNGPVDLSAHGPPAVVLFHSMFGLRAVELSAAERLRGSGHRVLTPDLFAGAVAAGHGSTPALEDGFALMERIGWDTIVGRARAAVRELPASTVLGGFSMGVGVIGSLWPDRPAAAGVFLLHNPIAAARTWQHIDALLDKARQHTSR